MGTAALRTAFSWSGVRAHVMPVSWLLTAKLGLLAANAVLMLYLARTLDMAAYGVLVTTIGAQLLISRLLMLGVDGGMMRLVETPAMRPRSAEIVSAGLVVMLYTSAALVVVAAVALPFSASLGIVGAPAVCLVAGAIGTSLVDYGYTWRLARHQYALAAVAQGGTAFWRLGLTVGAAMAFPRHPIAVFVAYHGASFISGLGQAAVIVKQKLPWPGRHMIRVLVGYSRWQAKSNALVIFSLHQGTFLLMLLGQPAGAGAFGLGLTLSLGFFGIYHACHEYLTVRVRSLRDSSDLSRFLARASVMVLAVSALCLPLLGVLAWFLDWFMAPAVSGTVPIFILLVLSMLVLVLQAPFEAACHYLLRPHLITAAWITRALATGIAGVALVPRMSAIGAAIAQVFGYSVGSLVLAFLARAALRVATPRVIES
jgi:O-antigen/teichoic acid export membrane protein